MPEGLALSPHPGPLFADGNAGTALAAGSLWSKIPALRGVRAASRGLLSAVFSVWGLGSSAPAASSRWTSHEGWWRGRGAHRGEGDGAGFPGFPRTVTRVPPRQEGVARGLSTLGQSPTRRCLARVVSPARWPFPRTRGSQHSGSGMFPGCAQGAPAPGRGLSGRAVPPQVGCVQVTARVS